MGSSRGLTTLAVVAGIFAALLVVQVFLAGLGVFDDPATFLTHRDFGYTIGMLTLVLLIVSIVSRTRRRLIALSALTLVQMALQSLLIGLRTDQPQLAALHPVNGFALLLVTIWIARTAWLSRTAPSAAPKVAERAAEAGA